MTAERKRLIDDIFLNAADLPPDQRQAYIDAACPDVDVAREVASLLMYDGAGSASLDGVVQRAAASLMSGDPLIGARLGPYRITEELGKGGMGTVFLAVRDDRTFEKKVAVKVVKRGMDSDAVVDRFRHERRILANLDHPYIGRLLDAGTTSDGRPYFVMEYVEGQPIAAYCKAHKLELPAVLELFRKVCDAVACAHRNLVVHRDLKASNILVASDGSPKLLDFGIAKLLDPQSRTEDTAPASRMLTLDCASPEQIRGETVTTSTDIYSLGILLFELLTGSPPWIFRAGASREAEDIICNSTPPKPSSRLRTLSGDLDNIVLLALRKDPADRYRSVDEFSMDILRRQQGLPVIAREDSVLYRGAKFLRRHWAAVSLGTASVLCLVGGIIYANVQRHRAEVRMTQMLSMANQTLLDLHTQIEHQPGATETRLRIMQSTLAYLANLAKDAGNNQEVRTTLGIAYLRTGDVQGYPHAPNLGDASGALTSYAEAEKLFNPDDHVRLATLYQHRGDVLSELGRVPESMSELQKALAQTGKSDSTESLAIAAETHNRIGYVLTQSNPDEAFAAAQREMAIYQKLVAREPDNVEFLDGLVSSYSTSGGALNRRQQFEEALAYYQKGLVIRERLVAKNPNDVALRRSLMISYGRVGDQIGNPARGNLGDKPAALQNFQKAREIAESLSAADPNNRLARMDLAQVLARVGMTLDDPGRERESLAVLDAASEELKKTIVPGKPPKPEQMRLHSWIEESRGNRFTALGETQNAIASYRLSIDRGKALLKLNPRDYNGYVQVLIPSKPLALQLASLGRREEALQIAHDACATALAKPDGFDPALLAVYVPRSLMWLGATHEALAAKGGGADWSAAAESYTRAYNEWQKLAGRADFFRNRGDIAQAARKALECDRRAKPGRRS